jgi:hypothetical protein
MSAVPEKISDEKLKELIAKTVSNGTFAELRTTRFDFQTPQQSLKSAQDRYAEHASGKAPLSPSESIALRGRINFLSNIVNPGQSNVWGDYSAAEKNYIAEKAAQQRSASNNLGMMFGGPVFSALPAIGRLFNAPEDVVEKLGVINADLAGVALGGGRVSPKPLARPGGSAVNGAPIEPIARPGIVKSTGLYSLQRPATVKMRTAKEVNAEHVAKKNDPPYKEGTTVIEREAQVGEKFDMIIDAKQKASIENGDMRLGGWATTDSIPNQSMGRDALAIKVEYKADLGYVARIEVTQPGLIIREGIAGPQGALGGGANQVELVVPPPNRGDYFNVNSIKPLPKP